MGDLEKLALAALLGGLIGLERQAKHRPAGLRTNLFICLGAAMFTLLSDQLAGAHTGDHTRIAAQIIPGIGCATMFEQLEGETVATAVVFVGSVPKHRT